MAEEKKVFDVAKPGSSAPEIGSKPMVAGHKMMKDPSITEKDDNKLTDEPIAQTSKIKIEPLSDEEKTESVEVSNIEDGKAAEKLPDNDKKSDSNKEQKEVTEDKSTIEPINEDVVIEDKTDTNTEKKENAEQTEADKAVQQEDNLQKIIKDKTYNVPIEEASYSAFKTFIKTFIIVFLLGIIILAVIVDAEIIDLGIELPFNFL